MRRTWFYVLGVVMCVVPGLSAWADELVMKSALVVEGVGTGGRTLIQTDAVEALRVRGEWKAPSAGDTLTLGDGTTRAWAVRDIGADGWLGIRPGGYAFWRVESPAERVMILEASGHVSALVNGEPRVGDPYEFGYVRVPVLLKAGVNEILLKSGRGRVRARLAEPKADVIFNSDDITVPDLLEGENSGLLGAIVVMNATNRRLAGVRLAVQGAWHRATQLEIPPLLPLSVRKVAFTNPWDGQLPLGQEGKEALIKLTLFPDEHSDRELDKAELRVPIRKMTDKHKRTFVSAIDGSVQYYAVTPPPAGTDLSEKKAVILSLHGASVEGAGQAACYRQRDWCYVIAPTNRRPYGFDWEDWGRTDALEVLAEARKHFSLDDRRTYLSGHSMGGHGTWNIGVQFPGTFAALGPSAGWMSFWSYAGGANRDNVGDIEKILLRATCTSDTLVMKQNFASQGIYILHGDADDNVPVDQARTMRKVLGEFHPDFCYYEQPGAGHWWGDQCVDWEPMVEFFKRHVRPETKDIGRVDFTTVNPAASSVCHWVRVLGQQKRHEASRVQATRDAEKRTVQVTTENVAALELDLSMLGGGGPLALEIDGQKVENVPAARVPIARAGDSWRIASSTPEVGPMLFKSAFDNRAVLIYGTGGTPEENAAMLAKARYDAEVFWYRGNGDFDVIPDTEAAGLESSTRNVILYGNRDINRAWAQLVPAGGPADVARGGIRIGGRALAGDVLGCLAVVRASGRTLGLVGGTGPQGLRLTDRLPYFVSGVGIPDWVVMTPEMLAKGAQGVLGAGFFGAGGAEGAEAVWTAP